MLPAGRYYVGDLCYFISHDEWHAFLDEGYEWDDGEGEWNGQPFAMYGTKYGDGCYLSKNGLEFGVDSGTLGCIRVADSIPVGPGYDGHILEFKEPFDTDECDGKIYLGHIVIDTDPDYDEDDE